MRRTLQACIVVAVWALLMWFLPDIMQKYETSREMMVAAAVALTFGALIFLVTSR